MNNWDEFGICRTCKGSGYFVQPKGTILCPDCQGRTRHIVKDNKGRCPVCGGLGYVKACCGQPNTPCNLCSKEDIKC